MFFGSFSGIPTFPSAPEMYIEPGKMKVLKQKLQRHSCTRQWVGLDSDKIAVSHDEQERLGCPILAEHAGAVCKELLLPGSLLFHAIDIQKITWLRQLR